MAGLIRLCSAEHSNTGKLCNSVLGVDANALYLYCMMRNMPIGDPVRTRWIDKDSDEQAGRGVRYKASVTAQNQFLFILIVI